ncbi:MULTISPECIES: cysteine hydrolase family protein [Streptomyces]|uniref:cysteine hydrolase family protein n=1 Tax=Streptomyces TaxID=1883 RepID=UPI00140FDD7C|nr:isochorismatase family cysteine hydrolase [Streptomyces rhizosphaericus]
MTVTNTALLVLDFQRALVSSCLDGATAVERATVAIAKAHQAGLPVIYGAVRLRPNHAEVSDRNEMFAAVAQSGAFDTGASTGEFHDEIAPADDDIVFVKRRVSAFSGSDLDVILRSLRIERVVLTGLFTSGVVLSTLREAADRDFQAIVLADACADPDPEVHKVLLTKVFPAQALVQDVDSWNAAAVG